MARYTFTNQTTTVVIDKPVLRRASATRIDGTRSCELERCIVYDSDGKEVNKFKQLDVGKKYILSVAEPSTNRRQSSLTRVEVKLKSVA